MKIAVTGAGGSLSRALAACAERSGETLLYFPKREQLDLAGPVEPVKAWLAIARPDAIIHLAGWRHGADISAAFRDNVAATYNLLDAVASSLGRTRVVVASSAAVYGNVIGQTACSVSDERRPINAYGFSKALQEDVCALARASSGADVSIARIFNVVAAPADTWSVIPSLIARIGASTNGTVVHVANARCTRDFVHVDDVCNALLLAATLSNVPSVFNVSTGVETPIASIAQRIAKSLNRIIDFRFDDTTEATTVVHSVGDPSETLAMGWKYRLISDSDLPALASL